MSERKGPGPSAARSDTKPRIVSEILKPLRKFLNGAILEDIEEGPSSGSVAVSGADVMLPDLTSSSDSENERYLGDDGKSDSDDDSVNCYDVQNLCLGDTNDRPKQYRSEVAYPNSFLREEKKLSKTLRNSKYPIRDEFMEEEPNPFHMVEIEIVDRDPNEVLEEERPKLRRRKRKVHRCRFAPKFRHLCSKNKDSIFSASFANGYYSSSDDSGCTSDEDKCDRPKRRED